VSGFALPQSGTPWNWASIATTDVAAFDIREIHLSVGDIASCNEVRLENVFTAKVHVLPAEMHILLRGMRITILRVIPYKLQLHG